jgi:hypothetical protein
MALPWRLGSQVYVAFLGGPVALTAVAVLNAARLRMSQGAVALVVALGVLVTAAGVVAATLIDGDTTPRLVVQVAGVLLAGPLYLLQRAPDRVHSTFSPNDDVDDDYASLWVPGTAACIAGWIVQGALVAAAEAAL